MILLLNDEQLGVAESSTNLLNLKNEDQPPQKFIVILIVNLVSCATNQGRDYETRNTL